MKRLLLAFSVVAFVGAIKAQEMPQPSPHAKLEQKVGLTDVTLDYSRPGVKSRTIFGDLVAFDKLWRFGANGNTMITFSTDVKIDGKDLKAGTYSLFPTPSKEAWVIAFNTDIEQWGEGDFKEEKNALEVKAKPQATSFHETFTLEINKITVNSAVLVMVREKTRIEIPFTMDTDAIAEKSIEDALKKGEDLDKVNYQAAKYYHSFKKDDKKALKYIDASLKIKEIHSSMFLKAQILMATGDKTGANKAGMQAHDLALKADAKGWAKYIEKKMGEWK